MKGEELGEFSPGGNLLRWFEKASRDLPWRVEPRNPYHTLVSELMLQQTQMDRVVPKFEAFILRFPSLESLASAREDYVLSAWSGLGYYRRARLLHRLAREISPQELPEEFDRLRRLPGIGPYTAAAIASLAFGRPEPVLDANVRRVGARVSGIYGDVRKASSSRRIEEWVRSLFPGHRPGSINEALMELGALLCTPSGPRCSACPLRQSCRAWKDGRQEDIPARRKTRAVEKQEWITACLYGKEGLLLQRIKDGPILQGLWMPPMARLGSGEVPKEAAAGLLPESSCFLKVLSPVSHSITYRRMRVYPVLFEGSGKPSGPGWRWASGADNEIGTSTLLKKIQEVLVSSLIEDKPERFPE